MKINYRSLTTEKLEELIEDVNWAKVPVSIITDDIVRKFSTVYPIMKPKIWLHKRMETIKRIGSSLWRIETPSWNLILVMIRFIVHIEKFGIP